MMSDLAVPFWVRAVLTEQFRRALEDLHFRFQLTDPFPGLGQLGALRRCEPGAFATVNPVLTDPVVKAALADAPVRRPHG